jgi:hypothetical protein
MQDAVGYYSRIKILMFFFLTLELIFAGFEFAFMSRLTERQKISLDITEITLAIATLYGLWSYGKLINRILPVTQPEGIANSFSFLTFSTLI